MYYLTEHTGARIHYAVAMQIHENLRFQFKARVSNVSL